jgi:hypothetical protein
MAALFSTGHGPQLLFRPDRISADAMSRQKSWRFHAAANTALSCRCASASLHGNIKKNNASWHVQRARMLQQLEKEDGKHLIVVSYGHGHSVHDEWVYNRADIDSAPVIFARAMNNKQDCQLVEYFKSRRIWSLDVVGDQLIPKLKPYLVSLCK